MATANDTSLARALDPLGRNNIQIAFEVSVAVVIGLVTILGNCLVVFVVRTDGHLKNITNKFIQNLAFTDIAMALLVMPFWVASLYKGRWIFSKELCDFTGAAGVACGTASLQTMAVIAVNRYLKVVKPPALYMKVFPGMRMSHVHCAITWLIGVLSATPPLYGWGRYAYNERSAVCNVAWEMESISSAVFFSVLFGATLGVIQFCYYKIYRKVKATSQNVVAHVEGSSQGSAPQVVDIKLLKVTFTIVCAFLVCYTPAAIVTLCDTIAGPTSRSVSAAIMYLIFIGNAVNPVIYSLTNPPLRRAFGKVLRCSASQQHNRVATLRRNAVIPEA